MAYSQSTERLDTPAIEDENEDANNEEQEADEDANSRHSSNEALSSRSTLINIPGTPTPRTSGHYVTLVFDPNSILVATLYSQQTAMYRLSTSKNHGSRTDLIDIRDAEGERGVVATIKRRDIRADLVMFAHRGWESLKISKWLTKWKGPGGGFVLEAPFGSQLVWKSNRKYRLALYPTPQNQNQQLQLQSPLAKHKPINTALQPLPLPPSTSATARTSSTVALVLRAGLPETLKLEIIISFLILERRLRLMEKDWEMGIGRLDSTHQRRDSSAERRFFTERV